MGYDNLNNYFKTNFAMMQHYYYSLSDIEGMIPWERFVYVDLLKNYIRQKEEELKERQNLERIAQQRK